MGGSERAGGRMYADTRQHSGRYPGPSNSSSQLHTTTIHPIPPLALGCSPPSYACCGSNPVQARHSSHHSHIAYIVERSTRKCCCSHCGHTQAGMPVARTPAPNPARFGRPPGRYTHTMAREQKLAPELSGWSLAQPENVKPAASTRPGHPSGAVPEHPPLARPLCTVQCYAASSCGG